MPQLKTVIKLQIAAGKANPAPPVGPALGQHGINIQEFCTRFNDATREKMGDIIPVEISVFEDRSFEIKYKTPPASTLILKSAKLSKGSANPNTNKVGKITQKQCAEIAQIKMEDLNARDLEEATKIIAGTAKSMGIVVE
jgi:large subunit ribosomal protein L11